MSEGAANWFVYIIETNKQSLYTGVTTDVARRFSEHLAVFHREPGAKGAKFFRTVCPTQVVHQEIMPDRASAQRREREIKKMSAKDKRRLFND